MFSLSVNKLNTIIIVYKTATIKKKTFNFIYGNNNIQLLINNDAGIYFIHKSHKLKVLTQLTHTNQKKDSYLKKKTVIRQMFINYILLFKIHK